MTIGDGCVYQKTFDYSINASKVLNIKDGDIDVLLKLYSINHKTLEEMIKSIQEWYEKQPHLPQGQLHDRMILGHLMTRGFSVEQCKEKIDNYFSARDRMIDLLGGRSPLNANMDRYLKEGYWIVPPMKTKENHRIIMFRILSPDMVVLDVAKLGFMMGDYRLFNETTQGDHWIFDFSNATLSHAMQFTPILMSKIYYHITSCYAIKIKGLHLVNVPSFGHSILALFKKIMKPKHVERLHLYNGFEQIFKVLPRENFPSDLGGTAKMTIQDISDAAHEALQSDTWKEFFEHQDKNFNVDENKRITASKITDTFGSCYAIKIKGFHLVNVPSFGHSILALFKKIMKPKHVERLHLYNGFEQIFKVLPREVFPSDLGGTAKITVQDISDLSYETLQSDTWKEFYANHDKNFHVDESKRIISSSKINGTFGVEGSFRKLQLD